MSALAVAWALIGRLPEDLHPLMTVAIADLGAMCVVFGFAVAFDNSSFYDPYWSISPPAMVVFWGLSSYSDAADGPRVALVSGLVFMWGARLTYNWLRRWSGVADEDWRYAQMRRKAGRGYWLVSLLGFHLFPTVLVFVGCLPLAAALTSGAPLGPLGLAGVIVMLAGTGIEAVADQQLRDFCLRDRGFAETLSSGLWRYSRHPNYFGEWLFWVGLYLVGLDADPGSWWTVVGPGLMLSLFMFISIPMIEARMLRRRAYYAERIQRVSSFVPWPPVDSGVGKAPTDSPRSS